MDKIFSRRKKNTMDEKNSFQKKESTALLQCQK